MALLSVAEFRNLAGGAGAVSDQAVSQALNTAEARINRAHGVLDVNRQATWYDLNGSDDCLSLPKRATAITSVTVGAVTANAADYALVDGGWSVIRRRGNYWSGDVVVVYTPEPFLDIRKQMQQQLALRALGYTGLGDQSIGSVSIKPLSTPEADDLRILSMLSTALLTTETLPDLDTEV